MTRVPGISEELADQVARIVRSLRTLELKKAPVGLRDPGLGPHPGACSGVETIDAERRQGHAAHPAQVPSRHRAGHQGAAVGLARAEGRPCSTSSPASSPSCARPGCPVSLTEHLDAAEAVKHIPLEDREALKYALAATLVKSSAHWRAFETAFEVYFAVRTGGAAPRRGRARAARTAPRARASRRARAGAGPGPLVEGRRLGRGHDARGAGRAALQVAARAPTPPSMNAVARKAVDRYAGMEPGRPVGGTYYLYRTLRNLDLDAVLEQLMGQAPGGTPRAAGADRARGAAGGGRVQGAHREVPPRRSRPRSAGAWSRTGAPRPWPGRCASRCPRTSTSCTPPARSWPCCTAPSSRSPASSPCAWPASAATGARVRSTSGPPCGARCRPVGCRLSRGSGTRGRPSPRSS